MKQIKIEWQGASFTISEREAFELGERIEEIVTLSELSDMAQKPKFRKLARCYAEMLNFAGAIVTPAEVHSKMMDEIKNLKGSEKQLVVAEAIGVLIEILMDGAPEGDVSGGDDSGDGKKPSRSSNAAT